MLFWYTLLKDLVKGIFKIYKWIFIGFAWVFKYLFIMCKWFLQGFVIAMKWYFKWQVKVWKWIVDYWNRGRNEKMIIIGLFVFSFIISLFA